MTIVTLLSDFGTRDEYVGVVKGVILTVAPQVTIVDIAHHIAPRDVPAAADMLAAAFPYFPSGSVHLAVVDPGVGSARRIVCAEAAGHRLLAPDNGLLTRVLAEHAVQRVHQVTNTRFFRVPVSPTFHGRDIFAPVAGHLAQGGDMAELGPALDPAGLQRLDLRIPRWAPDRRRIEGSVTAVDRFGNLITNITRRDLELLAGGAGGPGALRIRIGPHRLAGLAPCYAGVPPGHPLAVIGSRGRLEIAVNGGSAAAYFASATGKDVWVALEDGAGGHPGD
jgi:S-adenosylmethionine hydrolase